MDVYLHTGKIISRAPSARMISTLRAVSLTVKSSTQLPGVPEHFPRILASTGVTTQAQPAAVISWAPS